MPEPYLVQIASRPHTVSSDQWTKWYREEHLLSVVESLVAKRAAVYIATSELITSGDVPADRSDVMPFLAMLQTSGRDALSNAFFTAEVRRPSTFLGGKAASDVGDFKGEEMSFIASTASVSRSETHEHASYLIQTKLYGANAVSAQAAYALYHRNLYQLDQAWDGNGAPIMYRAVDRSEGKDFVLVIHQFEQPRENRAERHRAAMEEKYGSKPFPYSMRTFEARGSVGYEPVLDMDGQFVQYQASVINRFSRLDIE